MCISMITYFNGNHISGQNGHKAIRMASSLASLPELTKCTIDKGAGRVLTNSSAKGDNIEVTK
ncbi:MAG: hypothetical protein R3B93_26800 [Bacteroidia bacterium]